MKTISYLTPTSFCRGVERSINHLNKIIEQHPDTSIYCIHAIVHNPHIQKDFEDRGVIFVETIDEIDDPNAVVTFSAHGADRHILATAKERFAHVYNLECLLVTKIYNQINGYIKQGVTTFFYIAKDGHQEAKNVESYAKGRGCQIYLFKEISDIPVIDSSIPFAILSQTTLNYTLVKDMIDNIQAQYPNALLPALTDICKATYDRQTVVIQHIDAFDTLIVIGGKESHNTHELVLLGEKYHKQTLYAESADEILALGLETLFAHDRVAVTGGASTPDAHIRTIFNRYRNQGHTPQILKLDEKPGDYH